MYMEPPRLLVQNAVETLVINGLFASRKALQLQRIDVPVDLVAPLPLSDDYRAHKPHAVRKDGVPPRPPSPLGPPGNLVLSCSIGKEPIGNGRSSLVYEAQHKNISDPSVFVPPLVLKIARRSPHFTIDFALEKWFYDEMESIQGVAVPWCYGLFEVELSEQLASEIRPWNSLLGWFEPDLQEVLDFNYSNQHEYIEEIKGQENHLYIMVLERLGGMLPVGEPISEEDINDVKGLYENLGRFCVCVHRQVRHENILRAPTSPPGLASRPSEVTKMTHQWRLVDFSDAFRQGMTEEQILKQHMSWVERLLRGLPSGRKLEPF